MSKPNLPEENKRSEKIKVSYSNPEKNELLRRAKGYGTTVARFIREITLSDDKFQIISPGNKKAAKRARTITDLLNQLYIHRLTSTENNVSFSTLQLQPDSNRPLNSFAEEETLLWRRVTNELNILNAELLGYADNDD